MFSAAAKQVFITDLLNYRHLLVKFSSKHVINFLYMNEMETCGFVVCDLRERWTFAKKIKKHIFIRTS